MGAAAAVPLAITVASTGLSIMQRQRAADIQRAQYEAQRAEQEAAASERSLARTKRLGDITAQLALTTQARGGSGSAFSQLSQRSWDEFKEDERTDRLNLAFKDAGLRAQIGAVDETLRGGIASDILGGVGTAFAGGMESQFVTSGLGRFLSGSAGPSTGGRRG